MLKIYKTLRPYLSGEGRTFLLGVLSLLVVDGLQIVIPRIVRVGIDRLALGFATPKFLLKLAGIILLLTIGIVISRFFWRYLIIGISRRMEMRFRHDFYKHLISLEPGWFAKNKVGNLMALATNDLNSVRMMVGIGTAALIDTAILLVASISMMLIINANLTAYIVPPMLVLSFVVGYFGNIMRKRFKEVQAAFASLTDFAREAISGIRIIKTYAREEAETERFRERSWDFVKKNIRMLIISGLLEPSIGFVVGMVFALILLVGGTKVVLMKMSMGDFVAFNSYLGLMIWPMIALGWVVNLYQRGKASLERIMDVMKRKPAIVSPPDAYKPEKVRGGIVFRNLTFRYEDYLPPALEDINLKIDEGMFIAITGRTGSGKTTLISLIPRLYDPPEGTVFVDGVDVRKYDLDALRGSIGLVPQDGYIFSDTIMENIKFGRPDATDEEAIRAAKIAELDVDVRTFPDGYNSMVGERGVTLSGGQKQRLAIARALLLDPPILILDDALSAVDTETESKIFHNLREFRRGKTTLFISHRVTTLQDADLIVVLDRGRIIEVGTHQELIEKKGYYYEIYMLQQYESELV